MTVGGLLYLYVENNAKHAIYLLETVVCPVSEVRSVLNAKD